MLEYGWAYGSTGHAFEGKEIMLAVSAGSGEADYQHDGSHHATMEELLKPFATMADYVGARYLPPFVVYGVGAGIDDDTLAATARRYAQVINAARYRSSREPWLTRLPPRPKMQLCPKALPHPETSSRPNLRPRPAAMTKHRIRALNPSRSLAASTERCSGNGWKSTYSPSIRHIAVSI